MVPYFLRARGAIVKDLDGNEYIDFNSGARLFFADFARARK